MTISSQKRWRINESVHSSTSRFFCNLLIQKDLFIKRNAILNYLSFSIIRMQLVLHWLEEEYTKRIQLPLDRDLIWLWRDTCHLKYAQKIILQILANTILLF